MPLVRETNAEPIPGYRLIEPLGSGKYGEVWKCVVPGGLTKAIKFVYGNVNSSDTAAAGAQQELSALERVKAIRHPFILSLDRVETIDGELVIVMELADQSLHDLLVEYQKAGKPGIPREELLDYLREAAEALDLMNQRYHLQHLDIKPRNLFLVANHVKVADFGLVNNTGVLTSADVKATQVAANAPTGTPLYASPEAFRGEISRHSDQYSLAIVCQELLTGTLPFTGRNFRQLAMQHIRAEPDLKALDPTDRPILAKALAKDPEQRFPSCMAMIKALATGQAKATPTMTELDIRGSGQELRDTPGITTPAPPQPAGSAAPAPLVALSGTVRPRHPLRPTDERIWTPPPRVELPPPTGEEPKSLFECLPGYQFLDNIGRSPLGEVWRVQAPDGRLRQVKFIYGFGSQDPAVQRDLKSVVRLKTMRHAALAQMEVVQSETNRLVILSDPVDQTLRDVFQQCQAEGLPGIPRHLLLSYLRRAADALDYLAQHHSIQHLGLNPRNLLIVDGKLQVADFGLVQLLWVPTGHPVAQLNSRYSAPELFEENISRSCDQYSLALIYQEMLTGTHPLRGQTVRHLASARLKWKFDLDPLPAPERKIIARALEHDPQQRFPTCMELLKALRRASSEPGEEEEPVAEAAPPPRLPRQAAQPTSPNLALLPPDRIVTSMVMVTAAPLQIREHAGFRYLVLTDGTMQHRCGARLPPGVARHKLDGFRRQWKVEVGRDEPEHLVYLVNLPKGFFQRQRRGVGVQVLLARPRVQTAALMEVNIELRPFGMAPEQAATTLQEMGPRLLESIRDHLQAHAERRTVDRLAYDQPLSLCPLFAQGQQGEAIECRGKDVSLQGLGFYMPVQPPCARGHVYQTTVTDGAAVPLPVQVVRAQPCGGGWFEVGVVFQLNP